MKLAFFILMVGIVALVSCAPKGGKDKPEGGKGNPEGGKGKPGNGKERQKPCNGMKNIVGCTCEDGVTYNNMTDLRTNCKKSKNPVVECECKDGSVWEVPSKDEEELEEEEEEEEDEKPEEDKEKPEEKENK